MAVQANKPAYDCSFDFDNYEVAKKYKFVVIHPGDLDLNGAIMIRNRKSLIAYMAECARNGNKILQVFEGAPIIQKEISKSAAAQNKRR